MPNNIKQIIVTILVVIVILLMLFFGISFITSFFRNIATSTRTGTRQRQTSMVTINEGTEDIDIIKEPEEQYEGRVEFTATVDRVIGVRAFVVRNTEVFGNEILIISQDGIAPIGAKSPDEFLIKSGDRLHISGSLEKFNINDTRRNSALRNLVTVNLNSWNGKPVIIATEIDRIQ